jgi:hypothetical protein
MKKPFYFLTSFTLVLGMFLALQSVQGQTTLTWTGEFSTDAMDSTNWDPQQPINGNWLVIDSAYKYTNLPVFGGAESVDVYDIDIYPTGVMTIDFDDSTLVLDVHGEDVGSDDYFIPRGTINIENGILEGTRLHLEDTMTVVNVYSGGVIRSTKYFFMSGYSSAGDRGAGFLNIEGTGKAIAVGFGRFPTDTTKGVITLSPMGSMELQGDHEAFCLELMAKGQLVAAAGWDVVPKHIEGVTYVTLRDENAFVIEPDAPQFLVANEAGEEVHVIPNQGWAGTTTFQWQYATVSGGPYTDIAGETNDTIVPMFTDAGKYYLICLGDGTNASNEVVIYVGSDLVTIDPSEVQYLRVDKDGAMLTVTRDASITGVEWKWSTTPGEGHVSFSPAATADEFTPVFDAEGIYYVICEGTDGVNFYPSKDVMIIVDETARDLYWKGSQDNSADNAANWSPLGNVDGNNARLEGRDTYTDSLVFSGAGYQVVREIIQSDKTSTVTIDKGTDTLYMSRGPVYGIQNIFVESGVIDFHDFRLESGTVTVNGGECLISSKYFMMGNKSGSTGGFVNINGDGIFSVYGNQPDRFSGHDSLSIITISDNGLLRVTGDWRGGAETRIGTGQLTAPEGYFIHFVYDAGTDMTYITAKSESDFNLSPRADGLTGVGMEIAYSTVNDGDRTGFEWKYDTVPGRDWVSFSPAQTSSTFTGTWDAVGEYRLIVEGYGASDTLVSSEVIVTVVSVTVAPDADQEIQPGVSGTQLEVTESMESDSRVWKSSTTSGSGYTPIIGNPSDTVYTPLFAVEGTYYVVCASTFGSVEVTSNEVKIVVASAAVTSLTINLDMRKMIKADLFDPANDYVDVAGSFNGWDGASHHFADGDGDSIYTLTISPMDPGDIEYKCRINGSWEGTEEFPSGGPNRTFTVVADIANVIDIEYNDGDVSPWVEGIDNLSSRTLRVYPNPAYGEFYFDPGIYNVYSVTISDMLGRTVWTHEFDNVSGPQSIRIDQKGVFFVKMHAGDQVHTGRIILK